jgi:hypothetical protein
MKLLMLNKFYVAFCVHIHVFYVLCVCVMHVVVNSKAVALTYTRHYVAYDAIN